MLVALLLFGCVALAIIWTLETLTSTITPLDRRAYPILIATLLGSATLVVRRPQWLFANKIVVLTAINLYLVASVHLSLFGGDGPLDLYKMSTAMFWLPLCYSAVFVFLPFRAALVGAGLTFVLTFAPIVLAYVLGAAPARWGRDFPTLAVNLALAQTTYFLMLSAIAILRSDHRRTQERVELMRSLAATDVLTDLPNRRALGDALRSHLALAERGATALSVVLIDVDHFKQINDRHGHAAGDAALVMLARLLRGLLRGGDLVGRWGGEEFLIVTPSTSLAAAADLAERIRARVAEWPFDHGDAVSISLGVSQALPGDNLDALMQRADRALYRAKGRGRNRVEHQAVASVF